MRTRLILMVVAVAAATLTACGGTTLSSQVAAPGSTAPPASHSQKPKSTESPVPVESPVPAESNPPGDIPDSIAFVPYHSAAGGFTIKTPEGWARTTHAGSVMFTDKLNTVQLTWAPAASAPTVASAKRTEVPALKRDTRAFTLQKVGTATLPAGPAVLITYQANSDPNPVTGKQYRQDVLRYELYHAGNEVVLTLLSPVGADNVDPWRIVTESLAWR